MAAQTPITDAPEPDSVVEPRSGAPGSVINTADISLTYWDEPPESPEGDGPLPADDVPPVLAKILGGIGRFFIATGVLLLLFAAFQLWGTGLAEARAQDDLAERFAERLATHSTTATAAVPSTTPAVHFTAGPIFDLDPTIAADPIDSPTDAPAPTTPAEPEPEAVEPEVGEPIGVIEIPTIGVEKTIVEGTTRDALRSGPGHYRSTPLPGRLGNTAIAGHRTTHGAPFFDLDLLQPGDEIHVETVEGTVTYLVEAHDDGAGGEIGHLIVDPSEVGVIADQGDNRLTLTACHPKYSAKERIIVTATMISPAVTPPTPPVSPAAETISSDVPADPEPASANEPIDNETPAFSPELPIPIDAPADDTIAASLGWQREFLPQTLLWASITAMIVAAGWVVGRFWRRWPAYAMTVPPFSLSLFYCFANLEKFIPAV